MMNLAIDEIILQIRKGKEEAIELLFLCFEKHIVKIENKMIFEYEYPFNQREDLRIIMKKDLYEIVELYEMDRSVFFSFWKIVEWQKIQRIFYQERNEILIEKSKCLLDAEVLDFFIEKTLSTGPLNSYMLRDEYEQRLDEVKRNLGNDHSQVLSLWSEGYNYKEIASILKIEVKRVNYIIHKSLKHLRETVFSEKENKSQND